MVEVIVFVEGQTEEQFIKRLVAPTLRHLKIFVKPQLLNTSKDAKGGAVSFDRLKFHARNTLRANSAIILSTFLDLYKLDTDFPAFANAKKKPPNGIMQADCLEKALHKSVIEHIQCRRERFIPHIQPYEFEGLLFADVDALSCTDVDWHAQLDKLKKIREQFETPEHINDGYDAKPSKRLENLLKYRKTRHGPLAAERVTLDVMERECVHFRGWLEKLRGLTVL